MRFRLGIAALAVLLCGADALPQDALQETLLSEEKKLIEAIRQKDRPTLETMLANEAFAVTAGGGRQTGAQMLRSLDRVALDSYSVSEVKSVKVSDDVGILTYKYTSTSGRIGETPQATTVFATSTWALRDGRWRSVFYQETPIKE